MEGTIRLSWWYSVRHKSLFQTKHEWSYFPFSTPVHHFFLLIKMSCKRFENSFFLLQLVSENCAGAHFKGKVTSLENMSNSEEKVLWWKPRETEKGSFRSPEKSWGFYKDIVIFLRIQICNIISCYYIV